MTENFSQINIRHQITETGISENTKEDECKKLLHLTNIIFKLKKSHYPEEVYILA